MTVSAIRTATANAQNTVSPGVARPAPHLLLMELTNVLLRPHRPHLSAFNTAPANVTMPLAGMVRLDANVQRVDNGQPEQKCVIARFNRSEAPTAPRVPARAVC